MAGRNSRPIVVLKQGSMTTSRPPSNRIALWIIAVSLVVIATCLVWMAVQQTQRERLAREETQSPAPSAGTSSPARPARPALADLPSGAGDRRPQRPLRTSNPVASKPVRVIEQPIVELVAAEQPQGGALLPLATVAPTNGATVITGRATLAGKPPPENIFSIRDSICGKINGGKFTTRHYVVSPDGGLAEVFVHIRRGLEGRNFPVPDAATVSLSNCVLQPYVFGLMTNQLLEVRNLDKNRQEFQVVTGGPNPPRKLELIPGKTARIQFQRPEIPVMLASQSRPMVRAYGCITDNPFYAVTDANGSFAISNIPPGEYVLEAWHAETHGNQPGVMQSVTVAAGADVTANFTIQVPGKLASVRK